MRAYRRLFGDVVSVGSFDTITVPADTRWQLREVLGHNGGAAGTGLLLVRLTNAAGTVIHWQTILSLGPQYSDADKDLHVICEAGEKVSILATVADLIGTINAVVYDPA